MQDKQVRNQELEELLNELDQDNTVTKTASTVNKQKLFKSKTGISSGHSNNASPESGQNLNPTTINKHLNVYNITNGNTSDNDFNQFQDWT